MIRQENSMTEDFISNEMKDVIESFESDSKNLDLDDDSNRTEKNASLLKILDFVDKVEFRLNHIRSRHENKKVSLINILLMYVRMLNACEQRLAMEEGNIIVEEHRIDSQNLAAEEMKKLNLSLFIIKAMKEKLQTLSQTKNKIQDIMKENTRSPIVRRLQLEYRQRKVKEAIIAMNQQVRKTVSEKEDDRRNLIEALEQLEKVQTKKEKEPFMSLSTSKPRSDELFGKYSKEEAAKLKDYYIQFKKTLRNYHSFCLIAESHIFKLNKPLELALDMILSLVPYGETLFDTFQTVANHRRDMIQIQTFSDMISNPATLEEIIEETALTLIVEKESLILRTAATLEKDLMDKADNWVRKLFLKEKNLYKGAITGARIIGAIDASCIITNAYTNFIYDYNQTTTLNPKEDTDGVGETTKIFTECGKKADQKVYNKLFGIQLPLDTRRDSKEEKKWYQLFGCSSRRNKSEVEKSQIVPDSQQTLSP